MNAPKKAFEAPSNPVETFFRKYIGITVGLILIVVGVLLILRIVAF